MEQLLSRKCATPLLLMIVVGRISVSGAEKGCKASTAFTGSSAKITCYFDDNDARLQMNVFIEHLRFNASDHEIVASCQLNEGRYTCSSADGYRVVGNVTDFLTVEILNALPKHAGLYWCGGFGPQPLDRSLCKLNVTENLNLNGQRPNDHLPPSGNDDDKVQIKEDTKPFQSDFTIEAVVITCVVICIVIIVIGILCRHSRKKDSEDMLINKENIKD